MGSRGLALQALAVAAVIDILPVQAATTAPRPVDGIMDNSFLIEEAFNQDPGVTQHIFTGSYTVDRMGGADTKTWNLSFNQEWPVGGQNHQLSYTVPWTFINDAGHKVEGVGDVLLNYRYQWKLDETTLTGVSPRLSVVIPSGSVKRGLGDGILGWQAALPVSTTVGDRWFLHANAGLSWLPRAKSNYRHPLLDEVVGASAIYAATSRLHFLLEWTGTWEDRGIDGGGHAFLSVISPGVRMAFNFAGDRQVVLGLAAPLGLSRAAPEFGVFLYFSFEHPFTQQEGGSVDGK